MNEHLKDMVLALEIEKSKINREKSILLIDKGLLLYFAFLFTAVLGFLNGYVTVNILNLLVIMSFGVLAVAITPYLITMHKEEQRLNTFIRSLRGGKNAKM
ncbi:hypothetical protein JXB11_01480 [Candidatus Woesearchaeota archaeon]|nr:hypothetical protein [Candidatus Woesearchaeota archaeon]